MIISMQRDVNVQWQVMPASLHRLTDMLATCMKPAASGQALKYKTLYCYFIHNSQPQAIRGPAACSIEFAALAIGMNNTCRISLRQAHITVV